MKRKQLKFVVGSGVIILTLAFLAFSGYQESKAYFLTVPELHAMAGAAAAEKQLKVSGDVVAGSIDRSESKVIKFVISHENEKTHKVDTLQVKYVGKDAPPDTFIDRATAVVTGKLDSDGVFVAHEMTAKCASKYEKEAAAGVKKPTE
jgi:cytochrome c-type biogenesis protein CcmE